MVNLTYISKFIDKRLFFRILYKLRGVLHFFDQILSQWTFLQISWNIFVLFIKCVKVKRAGTRITIRWVRGVDKQDSTCIMEFLLCTINNNLMLSQNIPFHHKMIIYLNTKMFFLLFSYAYSEICSRENKESFMLSATSYLLWPPCW